MRDVYILSNCEKNFVNKIVSEGHRLDGRTYNESRTLNISFGSEYGSCIVSLGETKALAQVSCEVVQPKQIRPNEGLLYINVEMSPMAAPHIEANRQTDLSVHLNRMLEKAYKDTKCIDLESLCIVVEEKVWSLRVDIKILNHDGNLIECASIATVTALAHFKRPDVTRSGDSVIIHDITEKDPIPTVLFHYPVCTTVAIFDTDILLADPNFLEESVCTSSIDDGTAPCGGLLIVGFNQYKEICVMNLSGAALSSAGIVRKALQAAGDKCKEVVDLVKKAIISDDTFRQKRVKINFSDVITQDHLQCLSKKDLKIKLKHYNIDDEVGEDFMDADSDPEPSKYNVVASKPQTAEIQTKQGASQWIEISSDSEED